MLFPILTVSITSSAYITSGCRPILLLGIDIIDTIANLILIPFINKIDIAPIFYLNAFIILLFSTPSIRFFAAITTIFITISTLIIKIKFIYYPFLN